MGRDGAAGGEGVEMAGVERVGELDGRKWLYM